MLGAASQLESIIGRLDLAVVLLGDGEKSILLVHLRLSESVGENLVAQQPGDVGRWSSIAGDARRAEFAVGLESSLDRGLGDDLQLGTGWGVSDQQIHCSHEFISLDSQVTRHLSVVDGLHARDFDTALALLESISEVLELVVREEWAEDGGLLSVDDEATILDWAGHPTQHPQRFTFLLNLRKG